MSENEFRKRDILHNVSSDYIAVDADAILADATSGAITITLPEMSLAARVIVKKTDSSVNKVTVVTPGLETIDGSNSLILSRENEAYSLISDDANWYSSSIPASSSAATFVVAASDSLHKNRADYVCDGVDDQIEIQQAIGSLPVGGGVVHLIEGTYAITAPISVAHSDIALSGVGAATIIQNNNTSGDSAIEIKGNGGYIWRNEISNMRIKGNSNSGHGIYAYKANEILITHLWLDRHGLSGLYCNTCYENPRMADNNITYNEEYGIRVYNCHDIIISANQMEGNKEDGIYADTVWNLTMAGNIIDDSGTGGSGSALELISSRGGVITGNTIDGSNDAAVILNSGDGNSITGNVFIGNTSRNLYISGSSTNNEITGNIFHGASLSAAIKIESGCDYTVISGNEIGKGPYSGIFGISISSDHNSIVGNAINFAENVGICLIGGQYNAVVGNTIANGTSIGNSSGIFILDSSYNIISSNIAVDAQVTPTQKYGISTSGTSDYNIITDNIVDNNTVAQISYVGSNNKISGNLGFETRKSGTSTGTGAQQTIAHCLATTPTKVILWNIEDGANPYQSAAADGTNIYITAVVNQDYGWDAEVV